MYMEVKARMSLRTSRFLALFPRVTSRSFSSNPILNSEVIVSRSISEPSSASTTLVVIHGLLGQGKNFRSFIKSLMDRADQATGR